MSEGYQQVEDGRGAELVLYNTCSIRDKAEQKVFHRLHQFKREDGKGKVFGVIGCVAQQEGERIFERAPHVSLVAGSASYTKLPQMLVQLEAGNRRVTGLSLDTDKLSRRRSPRATIRIAPISPSSKAATNPAPIAWCRSRAGRSAAAPARAC